MSSTGVVLRIDAKLCHVEVDGATHALPLRGRLFDRAAAGSRPVAVGDRVRVTLAGDGGVIEEVLPRTSQITRARAGEGGREQVIAANVDLVLVTAAIAEPAFPPEFVDRTLAGAERAGIDAHLVITKVDRDRGGRAAEWQALYSGIGYGVSRTSLAAGHETRDSLAALARLLHAHTTVLIGHSGVGKSSLVNALVPGLDLRVGGLSRIRRGRHTTTHAQLVPLPGGGRLLDTPGMRNFGLHGAAPEEIRLLFRELAPLRGRCGYDDCLHLVEPGCAVRAALERGAIHESRFRSYRTLVEELQRARDH